MSTAAISTATVPSVATMPANEVFERDGCLTLSSLTTPADIELIRSLLDPLFAKFDTLGDRAVDLAGPREAGVPLRSPEINEAVRLEPRLRSTVASRRFNGPLSQTSSVTLATRIVDESRGRRRQTRHRRSPPAPRHLIRFGYYPPGIPGEDTRALRLHRSG